MSYKYNVFTAQDLISQPFWPQLHALINKGYEPTRDDWPFPEPYYRIYPDISEGAAQVAKELGDEGLMAVAFLSRDDEVGNGAQSDTPVACAAVMTSNLDLEAMRREIEAGAASVEEVPSYQSAEGSREGSGIPLESEPQKAEIPQWEFAYVITAREYRGKGLAAALIGTLELRLRRKDCRVHMIAMTVEEISGPFWRNRGYEAVEDGWIRLPKGFTHLKGLNGLRRDVLLWTGEKWLEPLN